MNVLHHGNVSEQLKQANTNAPKRFMASEPVKLNLDGKSDSRLNGLLHSFPLSHLITGKYAQKVRLCCYGFFLSFLFFLTDSSVLLMEACSSGLNIMFARPINAGVYENTLHTESWLCCRGRPRLTVVGTVVKINPVVSTAVATIMRPLPDSIKQLFIISGHNSQAFVPVR